VICFQNSDKRHHWW